VKPLKSFDCFLEAIKEEIEALWLAFLFGLFAISKRNDGIYFIRTKL
jgi:hypothetical protein